MATSTGMPAAAAFCTISTLQRLVMSAKPRGRIDGRASHGADQLVERVVAADILAHQLHLARRVSTQAAACTERVSG